MVPAPSNRRAGITFAVESDARTRAIGNVEGRDGEDEGTRTLMHTHALRPTTTSTSKPAASAIRAPRELVGAVDPGLTAAPANVREALASPGQPLDAATRDFMEPRFGYDFSRVRIHTDARAIESADAVGAAAYTVGAHIVLGKGQPSPGAIAGRQLLAHELAHVVQQSRDGPTPELDPSAPHEVDARAAARAIVTGQPNVPVACRTGIGVARQHLSEAERAVVTEVLDHLREQIEDLKRAGVGIIQGQGGTVSSRVRGSRSIGPRIAEVIRKLQGIIATGPGSSRAVVEATDALNRIRDAQARVRALNDELLRQGPIQQFAGKGERAAAKAETRGATAGVASTTTTTTAKVESTATRAVTTEAKIATSVPRTGSVLAKIGSAGLSILLPGPLDALGLMVQFAGAYAEAHDAIRNRETRVGFALGLAGSLLGRSERAIRTNFARRFVGKNVPTQVIGAVGVAEKAHNRGLNAGFAYGESLSDDARDGLREIGFTVMGIQRTLPGEYQQMLTADGVTRFGRALLPTVDTIFEAMQREARRQEEGESRRAKADMGCTGFKC